MEWETIVKAIAVLVTYVFATNYLLRHVLRMIANSHT